jgi:hypothetical protein
VLIPKGLVVLVAGLKMIVVPNLRVARGHSPNSLVGQQLDLPGSTAGQNCIVCSELLYVFDAPPQSPSGVLLRFCGSGAFVADGFRNRCKRSDSLPIHHADHDSEKLVYTVPVVVLYMQGQVHARIVPYSLIDPAFEVLFVIAYFRTSRPAGRRAILELLS